MTAPPSIFDAVHVGHLAAAAAEHHGPAAGLLAALQDPAVTGYGTPSAHPVVLGGRTFGSPPPGWTVEPAGRALAVAVGAALTLRAVAGAAHVWCLLPPAACHDGRTWEAAMLAAGEELGTLHVAVAPAGPPPAAPGPWQAAGWSVRAADTADLWEVLGAIDQLTARADRPGVLLLHPGRRTPPRPRGHALSR